MGERFPSPDYLQLSDVVFVDLVERRIAREAGVAAPGSPLSCRGLPRRRALLSGSRKGRIPGLRLNPETVDGEAGHRVAPDREDDLDELLGVVLLRQNGPRAIGDERLAAQLVGGPQHGPAFLVPTGGVRPGGDSGDFPVRQARLARSLDVMRPFVFGADQERRAHDEQFSRPGRQTRFTPQIRSKRRARGVQTGVLEHSGIKVQHAPALADLWGDHLALLWRPLLGAERLDARRREPRAGRRSRQLRQGQVTRQPMPQPWIQLHAETVQRHRNQLVLRRREDRFHHLLVAVFGPKRAPRRVADHRVVAQLVRHAQQAALEIGPARSFRPLGDAMYLLVGHARVGRRDAGMLRPLVFRLAQPSHAQHQHLPMTGRQARSVHHEPAEAGPSGEKLRMMRQRPVNIVVGPRSQHLALRFVAFLLGYGRDAWLCQSRREGAGLRMWRSASGKSGQGCDHNAIQ